MVTGLNATNGRSISNIDHLRQSIEDILSTPVGSRVMRRDYGSTLFELVDAPLNRGTLAQIYAAVADALGRWEPRFKLDKVRATSISQGKVSIDIEGQYLPEGRTIALQNIIV